MLPKHNNPQVAEMMTSLTIDEMRTEGVAAALDQCDYTANVRSQIGSVLDIFREFAYTKEYHRAVHEAVALRTASTVMYSVLPFSNAEALVHIVAEDKPELLRRVDEVAAHWAEMVPSIAEQVLRNAERVKSMFAALVDAIVGTIEVSDLAERLQTIQKAFSEGEYNAAGSGTLN